MSILLLQIILFAFFVFIYLFLFWRRLSDDYLPEPVFTSAFFILFFTLISGYLSTYIEYEHTWFWGASAGFLLSTLYVNNKFKYRFFELYESAARAVLVLYAYSFLIDWIINKYNYSLYGFVFIVFLIGLFTFFDNRYRRFTWYKSGKIGFAGLAILGILFFVRAIIGMYELPVISLVGKIEFIFSGIASFMHFFLIYHLSES